jgi:tetraacyldisaccharide 4'-kinase
MIYSSIIFLRNKLYDAGIFRSVKVSIPVISIGNISTGGTGKTPLTILTARHFLEKNLRVGIVSRGYKRKSDEVEIVFDGIKINKDLNKTGDELLMMANELSEEYRGRVFIAAGADRVKVSELIINNFGTDLIILDDGFQHRKIYRNSDIVILDAADISKNKFSNLFTLPSGNLRESMSGLKRADIIIQNYKAGDTELPVEFRNPENNIFRIRYKTEYIMDVKNSILNTQETKDISAVVFSGIANDDSFLKLISDESIKIKSRIKFSDHYEYKNKDIEFLKSRYTEGCVYITTEKDFVKIKEFTEFVSTHRVYYLKMKIDFEENAGLFFKILEDNIK